MPNAVHEAGHTAEVEFRRPESRFDEQHASYPNAYNAVIHVHLLRASHHGTRGESMTELNVPSSPDTDLDEIDSEVALYEHMSAEEVAAELQEHGIDPRPTIDAVTRLVRSSVAEWAPAGKKR
ncbi:MAG TPA: hypothetical protein VN605_12925 [Thermoanaerobaculia bacterium]|nr:hypothetical protein [Thermoanaerobaculia bacterium]